MIISSLILPHSEPNRSNNGCLGQSELNFDREGNSVCTLGNILGKYSCKFFFLIYVCLSSNLPEAILLYPCFKKIQKQTEVAKQMLGKETYRRRKKDNGMVIYVSIVQWALEVINLIIYITYIFFFNGAYRIFDIYFQLYLIAFPVLIHPSFYLTGDIRFRTNLQAKGFWYALKEAIFEK